MTEMRVNEELIELLLTVHRQVNSLLVRKRAGTLFYAPRLPFGTGICVPCRTNSRWPVAMQFAPGFKLRAYIGFRFPSCELWRGSNTASLALLFEFIFQRFKTILRACSYGQKLSRLARKLFDKFTSEISPCYENNMKSYIAFI
jgi:hypothetical protein